MRTFISLVFLPLCAFLAINVQRLPESLQNGLLWLALVLVVLILGVAPLLRPAPKKNLADL